MLYEGGAWEKLKKATENQRATIASWLWDQNHFGSVPTIDDSNIDALLAMPQLAFLERAKRLLIHLAEQSDRLGKPLELSSPRLDAMVGTLVHADLAHIVDFCKSRGWMEDVTGGSWKVTGSGLIQADDWRTSAVASEQAFVAMWFNPDLDAAWKDGFQKGILAAGYKALRIDNKEHANKICDEIISEIRRSRFLVSDYTGQRGGVYYEAGYASGRNLPVILTCRKSDRENLHFDIRQYNCIVWETPEELARRLQVRIEAVIGDGPLKAR
jgi:nucleoside 2-deoxyribosyltransferase